MMAKSSLIQAGDKPMISILSFLNLDGYFARD